MTVQELKTQLEKAIEKRDAEWVPGRAPRAWRMAVIEVEDLSNQIHEIELRNAPKSTVPDDFIFVDWGTYDDD